MIYSKKGPELPKKDDKFIETEDLFKLTRASFPVGDKKTRFSFGNNINNLKDLSTLVNKL